MYGSCPFKYFAERILGMAEIVEPEEELTSVNLGKFYHAVLRDFLSRLKERGSAVITDKNISKAMQLIEKMAQEHFDRRRLPDADLYWQRRAAARFQPFSATDYQTLRQEFAASERLELLDR
jgi:ATP-dependent helicase/DNAse subunit B